MLIVHHDVGRDVCVRGALTIRNLHHNIVFNSCFNGVINNRLTVQCRIIHCHLVLTQKHVVVHTCFADATEVVIPQEIFDRLFREVIVLEVRVHQHELQLQVAANPI